MAPILRSPPWPGVAADVGSVNAGAAPTSCGDGIEARRVARMMADRRVGGTFWARQVEGKRRLIVLRPGQQPTAAPDGDTLIWWRDGASSARPRHARIVCGDIDPWCMLDPACEVVCASDDEMRVLALAAGKRVTDHSGVLLDDEGGDLFRRMLFGHGYRDPIGGRPIGPEAAVELLARWRLLIDGNRSTVAAAGMAFWKRREVGRLLWGGVEPVRFLSPAKIVRQARSGDAGVVAAWPSRVQGRFASDAAAAGLVVRWVEDGFLRSVGLGSDLLPPLSLIVDDLGPYFDPRRPSQLELILEDGPPDGAVIERAVRLRRVIVERRIGKYRAGDGGGLVDCPMDRRMVVVVGQVEDDLSMVLGGAGMTNLSLLQRARAAEGDAFIIYRPHPDVEAGHRKGAIGDAVALALADRIDRGGSLDALLTQADALHTITSLAGFEALMRGVRVVVHGSPFYAGWGLTTDCGPPLPRRRRRLTLDELVAGALILYPRYLDPRTGLPCTPEEFIDGLGGVGVHVGWLVRLRRWQGRFVRWLGVR